MRLAVQLRGAFVSSRFSLRDMERPYPPEGSRRNHGSARKAHQFSCHSPNSPLAPIDSVALRHRVKSCAGAKSIAVLLWINLIKSS